MLTSKESKTFFDFIDKVSLEELSPPSPPAKLPEDYPFPSIAKHFNNYIDMIITHQNQKLTIVVGIYDQMVCIAERVSRLLLEPGVNEIWRSLYVINHAAMERFIFTLFSIERDYYHALGLIQKQQNEKMCYEKVIEQAQKLRDIMEEYECHYYGHMLQDNHFDLMDTLNDFIKKSETSLADFEPNTPQSIFCKLWPLSRKTQNEDALRVFFIRKIYLSFKRLNLMSH